MKNLIKKLRKSLRMKTKSKIDKPTTQMIDESNFDIRQYKIDLDTAYECGRASVLSAIEGVSRND